MNDYQRSLEGFNEPSIVDDQIQQTVEDSALVEGPQDGALHVERDSDGELKPSFETTDNTTQPVQQEKPDTDQNTERLDGLDGFLENSAVEIRDWIDNKLQGDKQSKEEIRANRQEIRQETARKGQETAKRIDEATDFGTVLARDGVRTITSGIDKAVQDTVGAANFIGDLAQTKLGWVDEDDEWNNVDHANYRGSERDLVMSEPRSAAGLFARDMVSFITVANKAKLATGLGAAGTAASAMGGPGGVAARIAVETAAGAVADFLMDPGDGNAANMLQEMFPSLQDNEILSAFAHDDDDDEYSRRVKNMVEGGVMGNAVDAAGQAMKGLLKGGGIIRNWLKKNPGKVAADAPAEVKAEAYEAVQLSLGLLDDVPTKPTQTLTAESIYDEVVNNGDYSRLNDLDVEELKRLTDREGYDALAFVDDEDAAFSSIDVDKQMEVFGGATTIKKLPNGSEIKWRQSDISEEFGAQGDVSLTQRAEAIEELTEAGGQLDNETIEQYISNKYGVTNGPLSGRKVVRIDWEIEGDSLGSGGTRLYRQFGEVAKQQKPGTIIQAEAAFDGYGAKGASDAQVRAGEKASGLISGRMDPARAAEINRLAKERYDGIYGEGEWAQLDREGRSIHIDNMRADEPDFARIFDGLTLPKDDQARAIYLRENPFTDEDLAGARKLFNSPDAETPWDAMPQDVRDQWTQRYEVNGRLIEPNKSTTLSIREKLYKRAGLSDPNGEGKMYGIVKYKPDGRKTMQPLDPTKPIQEQVDEAMDSAKQFELGIDFDSADVRPGKFDRYKEAFENGGNRFRQDFEPYERASVTTETPMGRVVDEQAFDASRPMYAPGAPSPRLTDNTVRQIAEAGGDTEVLNKAVKELEETFTPLLKANEPAVVNEAKERLARLVEDNTGEKVDMSALEEVVGSGADASAYVQTLLGNTVAKVYLKDLSSQLSTLGKQARQIADTGMDANKQYNLMLDRLKAAATIQIKDASRRGGALKTLQRNLTGGSDAAIKKKVDEFTTKVEDLRGRINEGDVSAVEEMQTLTDAMVLSDGNAAIAESFWTRWASMTKEDFEITMFNSYLSGINTQQRNIMGNAANLILKPVQMIMGASGENAGKMRQSSLAMYSGMWSDLQEGLQVARTALADNTPDSISKREAGNAMGENMLQKIANLRQSAKGPAQNAAANLKAAQYHLLANPWLQGATRLLDASDRGFRTLSARQKLRFDQNMLALEDGIKFDPKKYDTVWSTKFKNGEIADEQLLAWAKQDTFQEDLGENMSKVADMINTIPGAKYVIPFVKTPTNIIKQTAHYVPLVGKAVTFTNSTLGTKFFKEYDEVMRGSDEAMKAVYRGREATGYMVAVVGMGLGTQGLITGQGPSDPQKRELWEAAGNQQHSINIGGQWVSTRFLGPLGILLSAYADLGTMAAQPGNYDTFDKLRNQLIYTTAGALTDQSFLKGLFTGLEGLMDSMSGNPKEQKPGKWQADLLRAMTPYSAALRALTNTLTPGMREYDTEFDLSFNNRYAAEIGLKGILDLGTEKISMRSGEPVVNAGYAALNQFVPFSLKEAREDPLLNKLVDLGVDMPMEMTQKYKGMKLTVEEQNKINAFVAKSPVWDLLEAEINSESFKAEVEFWKNGPQGDDKRDWKPIPREKANWYIDIKADLAEARNDAIDALRRESVDFDTKIQAIEDRDFHGRRGNYYAANDAQISLDALKTF